MIGIGKERMRMSCKFDFLLHADIKFDFCRKIRAYMAHKRHCKSNFTDNYKSYS